MPTSVRQRSRRPFLQIVVNSMYQMIVPLLVLLLNPLSTVQAAAGEPSTQPAAKHRIYSRLLDPREHPDDTRRHVQPPSWSTFGNRTQFTGLRGLGMQDDLIVGAAAEIDKYTRTHELGDVIWPAYPIIFARNLADLADEIKRRDLFLFDIWGYVPGSGPGGYWQQFTPPPGVFEMLESRLGERWLGMDVGEQDGRYIGGYAPQMHPQSAGRLEQYYNFQRHFQRLCDDLGNRMSVLVSLNFRHYFLKEGVYALIGAETGQALPNSQVYYAFIRGAGKQYGVPWFGNVSVYNRWGFKSYGSEGGTGGDTHGPTKGTSLSLMKRLMYSHILYNSVLVGFESGFFDGEALSPIGRIQQSAQRWVRENGQPGVMLTPNAVMTDFLAGWTFPRHLYTSDVYRVWGNLPYNAGDHLTDGVLDLLFPGYANSSYFHDESGFASPTPYSDSADCLLSDAPSWLLERYSLLVVAGELAGGPEIRDKLTGYAKGGGRVVITAGSLARLPGGLAGITAGEQSVDFEAGASLQTGTGNLVEDQAFTLCSLVLPPSARVLTQCKGLPAVVETACGQGSIMVFASPFGVGSAPATPGPIKSDVDQPLANPYPLLKHVRATLDQTFQSTVLFDVGSKLSLITCRKGPGEYTLGVSNNSWHAEPLQITSRCGRIESIRELQLDHGEKQAVGYVPEALKADLGTTELAGFGPGRQGQIAGGDVRIFAIRVVEDGLEEMAHVVPPPRPRNRVLPLAGFTPIKEAVLARPTFFEHFDGVCVDWKYLQRCEKETLRREAGWIKRQSLRIYVDLTSGLNLYPELRLINNLEEDYAASMAVVNEVLEKMELLGAHDLILSLHRDPENNFTHEQTTASFEATLRDLCKRAETCKVTLHLRTGSGKPPYSLAEAAGYLDRVGARNLRLAVSTATLPANALRGNEAQSILKDKLGIWLVAARDSDLGGATWNRNAAIAGRESVSRLATVLSMFPETPVLLDAAYGTPDAEYLDVRALADLMRDAHTAPTAPTSHPVEMKK